MRYVAIVLLTFGNFDIRDYLRQRPFSWNTDLDGLYVCYPYWRSGNVLGIFSAPSYLQLLKNQNGLVPFCLL